MFLRIRSRIDKIFREIKTGILSSKYFSEGRAVYEIMWKNIVQPGRPQIAIEYGICAFNAV